MQLQKKLSVATQDYPKAPGGGEIYLNLTEEPSFIEGVVADPTAPVNYTFNLEKPSEPVPDQMEGTLAVLVRYWCGTGSGGNGSGTGG
ncbi:hypothetical protein O9929_00875 [Vibrio lentus]|nr:hypothetical protein [Vibrio lentus]